MRFVCLVRALGFQYYVASLDYLWGARGITKS